MGKLRSNSNNYFISFFLLFFFTILVYSNTFNDSWQLDDFQKIVDNPGIRMTSLWNIDQILKCLHADPSGKMKRPIPFLSFGINWYFNKLDVTGYHIVNIGIHILNGFMLFSTILTLFSTPKLKNNYVEEKFFIALLASVLWLCNPIQTQAVTYIVQRMASMAALFFIISIYFYLLGRLSVITRNRVLFFLLCVISFLFAVFSKQNTITLPIILFLIELIFFQDLTNPKTQKIALFGIIAGGLLIFLAGSVFFIKGNPFHFFAMQYENKSFTMGQRLLTQNRVLLYYLTLIFYPVPNRFSIVHDIELSTSLFSPLITLPSLILVLILIAGSIYLIRKTPILSFSILFFFVSHLVESTILPLAQIYEHRNYLPSFFLFFPVAVIISKILNYYKPKNNFMYKFFITILVCIMFVFGMGTYVRNSAWKTEASLWGDALSKAPELALPYQYLAAGHYEKIGNYDLAIKFYEYSLSKKLNNVYDQAFAYYNMGKIYANQKKNYDQAFAYINKSLEILPNYILARRKIIFMHIELGQFDKAENQIDILLSNKVSKNFEMLKLKGIVLLKQNNLNESLDYFRHCLRLRPSLWDTYYYIGLIYKYKNDLQKSFWFLKRADELNPLSSQVLLELTENRMQADDMEKIHHYLYKLIGVSRTSEFIKLLQNLKNDALKNIILTTIHDQSCQN